MLSSRCTKLLRFVGNYAPEISLGETQGGSFIFKGEKKKRATDGSIAQLAKDE